MELSVGIVGAGPSGSYCAEQLARRGHEVTLYDPSHPREKPCGGGVTPVVYLRHPELAPLRELAVPAQTVRLRGTNGRLLSVALPHPIDVYARTDLDGRLLERALEAGARLEPVRVHRARIDDDGAVIETAAGIRHHDFTVGADGPSSAVRRALLGERPGRGHGYATAGFYVDGLVESELYIEFVPEYSGYLWVFPRSDHASVGIAAPIGRENGTALRTRVLRLLEQRYPGSLALPRRPYAASIPCQGPRQAALGGARFGLVGDAAALVDAITGEGIQHALDSAALLADALDREGPIRAARSYSDRWNAGPGRELALSVRWARRYYRPAGVRAAFAAAGRAPWVRRVLADVMIGVQPYSDMPRRALRELFTPTPPETTSGTTDGVRHSRRRGHAREEARARSKARPR